MESEFNLFPQVMAALDKAAALAVKRAAFNVQHEAARGNGWKDPTGHLDSSIYVVTHDSSGYGKNVVGEGELLPEVQPPTSSTEALVAVGASYGIYQELGTSHIPPHPYLVPALEAVKPSFDADMSNLETAILENL